MQMPYQYTDVIVGHFRLRCYTTEEVETCVDFFLAAGKVPSFEPGPLLLRAA